ncbi:MAG: surface carbohydrate biosynthesis protein, partial [Thiogranum sp.]
SHRKIDFRIASLPRSLYLCKSFTVMNLKMFRIMHRLGQKIVSWDEEALVHLPADMYFSRRLSPLSLKYVSHLFAWGEDNARLWRQYPQMPRGKPIHITGNPRGDLLRDEVRPFYRDDADALRRRYGKYILVNTNFNHVNAFYPAQNLFRPSSKRGGQAKFGKAAKGMSAGFAEALRDHKQALFDYFRALIPALDESFPDYNIIVRPHPTENQAVYHRMAAACKRVIVTNEGNVVPWLMAAQALIHNGCTTAVEAYSMGIPALSYRPCVNVDIDHGFYRLPNFLSYQCFGYEELHDTLGKVLDGRLGAAGGGERKACFDRYIVAQNGPLACERMVDVLEDISVGETELPKPPWFNHVVGCTLANGRHFLKRMKSRLPGSHAPPEFHRHRYPGITLDELRKRISMFQQALGDTTEIKAEQIHDQIFRISA